MSISNLKRIFHSVFTKLILISMVTWFLILIAVVSVLVISRKDSPGPFQRNFNNYFQYIVKDIGSPPDNQKAVDLYQATGIHISYKDGKKSWTTRKTFPDTKKVHFRPFHDSTTLQIGREHGHHYLKRQTDQGTLFFEFDKIEEEDSRHIKSHLILLLLLSLILLGCYFVIKKVLLPLRWLNTGVVEVAEGNLAHRVPVKGKDELGELGRSFNDMTEKLKEMMTTKEHLLRDVSHELRSPLTRMRVALELIDDEEIKEEIRLDIEQMETMIAAILEAALVRHDSYRLSKTPCRLDEIITSVAARYKNMTPGVDHSSIALPVSCFIDKKGLETVLTNLIDNGLKFSEVDSPALEIHLNTEKNSAIITITDHGSGIDEAELPYIFEPFFRADRSRSRETGGFGLGLSLCKAIMEAHGGSIEVKSKLGEGTQILLTLPLQG